MKVVYLTIVSAKVLTFLCQLCYSLGNVQSTGTLSFGVMAL